MVGMEKVIANIKNEVLIIPMDGIDLATVFQSHLSEFGIEVTVTSHDDVPEDMATVNGYFNSFDWEDEINIELVLIVNDEESMININSESWSFLEHQTRQTLEHEMIHREQIKKRNGLVSMPFYEDGMTEQQKRIIYLSDPDEIDAYANDIVLDLKVKYNSLGVAKMLSQYNKITQEESPILCEYIDMFGYDSDIVKTIVKKAMKRVVS